MMAFTGSNAKDREENEKNIKAKKRMDLLFMINSLKVLLS
jgi:hypothetical protein